MFASFRKKTPPPGASKIRKVAFITISDRDAVELVRSFENYGVKCECFSSDRWQDLIEERDEYEVILIDFHLGGGLMSISISEVLLRNAYGGRIFLLAAGSMGIYSHDYASVLMLETVKNNPMRVFNGIEITEATAMADTVFMKKALASGRPR